MLGSLSRPAKWIRVSLVAAAVLLLPAWNVGFAAAPQLGRDYYGTFVKDGTTRVESFNMEVGDQHGKHFGKVSIFAMSLPEFQGTGNLKMKNAQFRCVTRATGKHAPKMKLVAAVGAGGDTLQGTYELKRYQLASVTGTFSVSR